MEWRIGSWSSNNSDMMVDGKLPEIANGSSRTVRSNVAGPGFFTTLGVPVLAGRDFADSDAANSPHVGIINEEFGRRFLPNQNPLGHIIGPENGMYQMTIVGVVKNHKYRSIDEEPIPMAWYEYVGNRSNTPENQICRRALGRPKRRTMSASARALISAAQKARWAKQKKARPGTAANKSTGRRIMSVAARKRISTAMKKRWAQQKKSS